MQCNNCDIQSADALHYFSRISYSLIGKKNKRISKPTVDDEMVLKTAVSGAIVWNQN